MVTAFAIYSDQVHTFVTIGATLSDHVIHVILMCSFPEMIGGNTTRVVAGV